MESSRSQAGKTGAQRLSPVAVQSGGVGVSANGRNGGGNRSWAESLPAPRVFSQARSPNTNRFLKAGASIIGEAGVRKLENGEVPLAREIRADSIKSDITYKGAGLHEIVPTDLRSEIAALEDQLIR